jgi:hypothetical protein
MLSMYCTFMLKNTKTNHFHSTKGGTSRPYRQSWSYARRRASRTQGGMDVHDSVVDRNDYEAVFRIQIRYPVPFWPLDRGKGKKEDVSKYVRKFITIFSKSWLCIKISKKCKYLNSLMWIRIWDPQHCYEILYCSTVKKFQVRPVLSCFGGTTIYI